MNIAKIQAYLAKKATIKTPEQYDAVMSRINDLLEIVEDGMPVNDKNVVELDILSSLIEEYEDIHYPISTPSLTDVLKLRMYEMGLSQSALASMLGMNQSKISEILSGKSEPTLKQARKISTVLSIPPSVVLGI